MGLVGGWKGGVKDVSSLAGRRGEVVVSCVPLIPSSNHILHKSYHSSFISLLLYRAFMSQMERAVACLRLCHGMIQFELLSTVVVMEWYRLR